MARESFERKLLRWVESHEGEIGREGTAKIIGIIKREFPGVAEERKKGRKKLSFEDVELGSYFDARQFWYDDDRMRPNFLQIMDRLNRIMRLFPNTPKDWAKLAVSLVDCSLINMESAMSKKNGYMARKPIYEFIKKLKPLNWEPGKNGEWICVIPFFPDYREFCARLKDIEEIEDCYPAEEREQMRETVLDELNKNHSLFRKD